MVKTVPNSAKYRPTLRYSYRPLQQLVELHQKDLRINLVLGHFLGLRIRHVLRADTFLALFLVVGFNVPRDPQTRRRVDIPRITPCQITINSQFIEY